MGGIIAIRKPSRQCSCRIQAHRNLHCMPGSGRVKDTREDKYHSNLKKKTQEEKLKLKEKGNMMALLQVGASLEHHSQSEQWSVPSANRRGVTFARLEVGKTVRDPVARCSCWLLHRIYTAYWATDRRHRLVIQVTGWAWSRLDGRSHVCRHSCIHLRGKGKRERKGINLYLIKSNSESNNMHN